VLIFFVLFRWVLFGQERGYPRRRSIGRFRYRRNHKKIQNFCNNTLPRTDSASLIHIIFRERRSRKNFPRRRKSLGTTMIADGGRGSKKMSTGGFLNYEIILTPYQRVIYWTTTPVWPRRLGLLGTRKTDNG
jgi:hypothetical protein